MEFGDADEVLSATTQLTAAHLGLSNCAYADMDDDEDGFTIRGNWHAPGSPSIVGHYRLADFGTLAVRELSAGRPLIINDNSREIAPYEAKTFQDIGIAATICMPLVKSGRLVALMAIHDKVPHRWTDYELVVIREVTERSWAHVERVRSDAELRVSNARFSAAIRATRGVLWTNDPQGRMVGNQPGWGALTGQSYEEYHGFGWAKTVHPEDSDPTIEAWNEAVAARTTFIFEHRLKLADGKWRLFSIRAVPVLDDQGEVTEWVGVHTDVHNERASEEALREGNETLELLNKTGSAIAAELDLERLVQMVTDAGVQLSGAQFGAFFYNMIDQDGESFMLYTLSGADRSAFELYPHPRATAVFAPTFKGERIIRSADITADPNYGQNPPYHGMPEGHLPVRSYLAVPVTSRTGEAIGGLFFCHEDRDVFSERSERIIGGLAAQASVAIDNATLFQAVQRANQTLEERVRERTGELEYAHEALRQSQKMEAMGQLTGGVAHDFNNLLTPIVGGLDMLQRRGLGGPREQRLIEGALQSADRAKTLVQRLLAFARRQPLQPSAVDVPKLVRGMAELIASTLGPQIRVVAEVGDDLPNARADLNQLEMALLNLGVNARDAMPDGGSLRISAGVERIGAGHRSNLRPGDYVLLSVADTGIGMDEETLKRAIEPFFSTKGVGQGTGLGLSMVHGLMSQLGGALTIVSQPGIGTNVELWLPVSDEAVEEPEAALAVAPVTTGQETALVVDDEDLVRASTADMLIDLGYSVVEASSAEDALQMISGGLRPDVVVTDHLMPKMTGTELARTLLSERPDMPILIVSGYAEVGGIAPDLPRLTKPFRHSELAASLSALNKSAK